ncbi:MULTISPECIES: META domain-containing protein [unclassified Psychrobacter]|uniref:META domain-containing protein n=1 Tax=unclassified Psychrobacter TaxID=196806 RepID=UPI0025B455EE|nr:MULTISPECIES: META domain-containing protein [unclassified Psychrobacter]MDN3453732.1 DUF4377 domain-containing protein [Psychrobacter sp. APC 3350]MDN3501953.1 DUF4377 domain-containing protein [Psychrobacter sp. 5A.1]
MVGSHKNPTLKVFLLPSVLMVSLMLSACQKESASNENDISVTAEAGDTIETGKARDSVASDNTMSNASSAADSPPQLTAEDKLTTILSHHRWTLVSATDVNKQPLVEFAVPKNQVTLAFSQYQGQDTLSYSVGCNTISAAYQLQGHNLSTEDGMSTKMSCSDLDVAENTLNTLMLGNSELKIDQDETPILTQFTNDDVTLVWSGRLTPQAKYHSKGETIFWAVKSQTTACEDSRSNQCLQVKPITYNDQGIKIYEGKWRIFVGDIDGYQHDNTHEEVLRLQRYQININELPEDDTADEQYAYILDAVIESSVVE